MHESVNFRVINLFSFRFAYNFQVLSIGVLNMNVCMYIFYIYIYIFIFRIEHSIGGAFTLNLYMYSPYRTKYVLHV